MYIRMIAPFIITHLMHTILHNTCNGCYHMNVTTIHSSHQAPHTFVKIYYSHYFSMPAHKNSTYLEERLRQELKTKLISAKNTTKIPTEKDILEAIVQHGDKCYLIADDYQTAFVEYEHLLLATEITLSTTGGAQKLFVEASLLSSKHRHLFLRRYDECTRFNNAHDIYEILTAGGILNELERTSSIADLANRNPKDAPNGLVNCHYERSNVNEMFKLNQMMFMELLEREEDDIKVQKDKIIKRQRAEEEENREMKKVLQELREMTHSLLESREETQPQTHLEELKGLKEAIVEIKKSLRIQEILHKTRDEKLDNLQESIKLLATEMKSSNTALLNQTTQALSEANQRIEEVINTKPVVKDTRTVATQSTSQNPYHTQTSSTQVSNADWYGIQQEDIGTISLDETAEQFNRREAREDEIRKRKPPSPEARHTLQERLRDLKNSIKEGNEILRKKETKPRKYGKKITKPKDATMDCIFCGRVGDHYSDVCPSIRRIVDRTRIIEGQERCFLCLSKHTKRECTKYHECFYCTKSHSYKIDLEKHHSAICPLPEEDETIRREIKQMKKEMEDIESTLRQQEGKRKRINTEDTNKH